MRTRGFRRGWVLGVVLSLVSCSAPGSDWVKTSSGQIELYSRPPGFSPGVTHPGPALTQALQEQEGYLADFEARFGVDFRKTLRIYLYNVEESNPAVGQGGGYADSSEGAIHYRFFPAALNTNGTRGPLGGHEIFHVLADQSFGKNVSRLLSEGGAVWFDGAYSSEQVGDHRRRKPLSEWMFELVGSGQQAPLRASELLADLNSIPEQAFYPQAGCWVQWLVETWGVEMYARMARELGTHHSEEAALIRVYQLPSQTIGRRMAAAGQTFEQWSDSNFGPQRRQALLEFVRQGNQSAFLSLLNLSLPELDQRYAQWLNSHYSGDPSPQEDR